MKAFKKLFPIFIIILIILTMTNRYLRYGIPHEFFTVEYKGTFEGDYDFTLELVDSLKKSLSFPLWSSTYSGPAFVFAANLHVIGQALLYFMTHNQAFSIKIYQLIYFILSGIGMYLLAGYIYKKRFIALFCSIIYMFTPYFIGEMLGYLHYSTTYFCLPLAYFFIFKALDYKNYIFYSVISALIIGFNLLSHPQNVFIAGLFYFFFASAILLYRLLKKHDPGKALRIFLIIAAGVILLSAFFWLPTLINGYPYARSLPEGGIWLNPADRIPGQHSRSHSQSFLTSISMLHWPWFITPLKSKEYPPVIFIIIYCLPFLLAAWGLVKTRLAKGDGSRGRFMLFTALGLVSLNFALGTGLHEFGLFNWAYKLIPFFHMARAPYRYFYQGVLSICLLSGLALYRMPKHKAVALFSIVAAPYLFAASYYGNHYNWTFIPSEEPKYFSQVQGWLERNNKERHRIIEAFITPSYLGNNQRMLPNGLDLLMKRLDKDYLDRYLSLFGFKYILAPTQHSLRHLTFDSKGYMPPRADDGYDDTSDNEEYYSALTTEFYFIYERLKADPGFTLNTAGTKDVAIFENRAAFDNYRLYLARGLMILGGLNAYDFIDLDGFRGYFAKESPLRIAPVFIAQSKNLKNIQKIKQASTGLLFHNTDIIDLSFLNNQKRLIFLSELGNAQWSPCSNSVGWAQPLPAEDHSLGDFTFGDLSFSDSAITTRGRGRVCNIPAIKIDRKDRYAIFLRLYGGENFSTLTLNFNNAPMAKIDAKKFRGFRWVLAGEGELEPGVYPLQITTEEDATAIIDAMAVLPIVEFNSGLDNTYADFKNIPIYFMMDSRNIMRAVSTAAADLYFPESGDYDFTLRLSSTQQAKARLVLKLDSREAASREFNLTQGHPSNIIMGSIPVARGRHAFVIEGLPEAAALEFICISPAKNKPEEAGGSAVALEYSYDNFGNYRGKVWTDKPLILVHTEAKYPGWRMAVKGKDIRPIVTNMFLNGFIIDGPLEGDFKIYYLNFWQNAGLVISLSALILAVFLLIRSRPRHG